jgi:hypothetical protein
MYHYVSLYGTAGITNTYFYAESLSMSTWGTNGSSSWAPPAPGNSPTAPAHASGLSENPTEVFLYNGLAIGDAVLINWNNTSTNQWHWLTLTGISFNTATGTGTISYVDPQNQPNSGALQVSGVPIYLNSNGTIGFSYSNPNNWSSGNVEIINAMVLGPKQMPSSPISLSSGWNLISLPLQPANTTPSAVLSGISGVYEVVWAYPNQTWQVYDPNDTGGSTLTTMQAGMGYWIKMTSAKTLSVSGSAPPSSLSLLTGWNLVGYSGISCAAPSAALSSISANLQVSWGYPGQVWQFYDPANSGSTLSDLCPGAGYWINVNQAGAWSGW